MNEAPNRYLVTRYRRKMLACARKKRMWILSWGKASRIRSNGPHFRRYDGNFLRELWLPLYLHIYPIVEFAAFVVSWSASCYLVVNLSQTQAFAAPPYDYSSQTIGFFNFALFIGGLIGLFTMRPALGLGRSTARRSGMVACARARDAPDSHDPIRADHDPGQRGHGGRLRATTGRGRRSWWSATGA